MAEKLSVVMARRHIRMAHVVLLMLDATEGVVALDTTIAGYAHEGGRALIVCVNKWDEMKGQSGQKKNEFEQQIRDQFKFLDYAPIVFLSAETGAGVSKLFKLIREVYDSASRRITTGELNRFVENLHFEERKIYYITQHSIRPPSFAVFTDKGPALHFSHERYLINQMRKKFGFIGTPILLETKAKKPGEVAGEIAEALPRGQIFQKDAARIPVFLRQHRSEFARLLRLGTLFREDTVHRLERHGARFTTSSPYAGAASTSMLARPRISSAARTRSAARPMMSGTPSNRQVRPERRPPAWTIGPARSTRRSGACRTSFHRRTPTPSGSPPGAAATSWRHSVRRKGNRRTRRHSRKTAPR